MNILIVSYFFPPYNTIGAVRTGKLAKYLLRHGHDVRVLSAENQSLPLTLPLEIPENRVIRTHWININHLPEISAGGRAAVAARGFSNLSQSKTGIFQKAGKLYKSMLNIPDGQVGWYIYALRAGHKLIEKWKPDIIYASAMPFTSLLVANTLSRRSHIPWVAELRDLWAGNYYHNYGPIRSWLDNAMERRTLARASGIVTVSDQLALVLAERYNIPVEVVPNGYDHEDYEAPISVRHTSSVKIVSYTGTIYPKKQDPTLLFIALEGLSPKERLQIQFHFYGRNISDINTMVEYYHVGEMVNVHPAVGYTESVRIQIESDALLLLLWNEPSEKGVLTGKLFEYIGAGRPIIAVGPRDNAAANLITKYGYGRVISNRAEAIAALRDIIANKYIYPGDQEFRRILTREEQTRQLESFLSELSIR